MFSFLLNLPYTLVGTTLALVLLPTKVECGRTPCRIIFKVKRTYSFGYIKNWRGMAIGNVIILNPLEEPGDLEHEIIHICQHQRRPLIYPILYYTELLRKGYRNNKYEVEAYSKAGNIYKGK